MGMFSGMLDNFADRQFAKDQAGRLVFLPRGPRRLGYYVGPSDEYKFKSMVKIYGVAAALINLTGSVASLALTQSLTFDDRSASLASKLKFGLVVYAISSAILYIGPALIFWNVYRGVVAGLCSSLTTVEPGSIRLISLPSTQRRAALILIFALSLILVLIGVAVIGYHR
jgi:fluoride ion exporter CrcB/FEX